MNNKELIVDFINYAKSRHIFPILEQNIEPLVEDYFVSKNDGKPIVVSSRESVVNECRDELLKQLFKVFHTNGYPIEAVPKATILSLPQLMRCAPSPIA